MNILLTVCVLCIVAMLWYVGFEIGFKYCDYLRETNTKGGTMNGHPFSEYANLNGVLSDEPYAPPRMIECAGLVDYVESCDECPCCSQYARGLYRCKLIAKVYWHPTSGVSSRIADRYTIHAHCPLKLYDEKKS